MVHIRDRLSGYMLDITKGTYERLANIGTNRKKSVGTDQGLAGYRRSGIRLDTDQGYHVMVGTEWGNRGYRSGSGYNQGPGIGLSSTYTEFHCQRNSIFCSHLLNM